jgi:hypothetical protein
VHIFEHDSVIPFVFGFISMECRILFGKGFDDCSVRIRCFRLNSNLIVRKDFDLVSLPVSHSPNPHTNLLNVFIQIANNKGILKKTVYFNNQDACCFENLT